MNINKRTIYIIVCCAALVILLVFIVKAMGPEHTGGNTPIDDSPTYTVISDSDTGEANVNHLYQQYSELVTIDTDIPVSVPDSADVLYAKGMKFDEQLLMSLFFNGEPLSERNESSDGSFTRLALADNSYIAIDIASLSYRNEPGYMHLKLATENFLTKAEKAEMPSHNKTYGEVYQLSELDFMTPEAAVAEVKKLLEPLSLTLSECIELYALDHETMQQYQDEYLEKYPEDREHYTIKDVLTEEDDCYLICFKISQDNIPMTQYDATYLADYRVVCGSVVKAYYSANGIIKINISGIYEPTGVCETLGNFISAEQAIELAIKAQALAGGKMTVVDTCFEYVGVPYNKTVGEVLLTPSWGITFKMAGGTYAVIHINAATGEVIK